MVAKFEQTYKLSVAVVAESRIHPTTFAVLILRSFRVAALTQNRSQVERNWDRDFSLSEYRIYMGYIGSIEWQSTPRETSRAVCNLPVRINRSRELRRTGKLWKLAFANAHTRSRAESRRVCARRVHPESSKAKNAAFLPHVDVARVFVSASREEGSYSAHASRTTQCTEKRRNPRSSQRTP